MAEQKKIYQICTKTINEYTNTRTRRRQLAKEKVKDIRTPKNGNKRNTHQK